MLNHINSPLEQFTVHILDMIPVTNLSMPFMIPSLILLVLLSYRGKNPYLMPSRAYSLFNIIISQVGELMRSSVGDTGRCYFFIIITLVWVLTTMNLLGLAPFVFATTSHVITSMFISISIWLGVSITGLRNHGVNYLTVWIPAGAPMLIAPILVVVEAVSFTSRAFSLGLRLAVNITAGHLLLGIIAGFTWAALNQINIISVSAILPIILICIIYLLEVGVAVVQAYVFTLLLCLYLADSLKLH